jgi:hypothetical protein
MEKDLKEIREEIIHMLSMLDLKELEDCFKKNMNVVKSKIMRFISSVDSDDINESSWAMLVIKNEIELLLHLSSFLDVIYLVKHIFGIKEV